MLKDHKRKLTTRPVVSGCSSNSAGMSNIVSMFLEAVGSSIKDPYEVVSSEDMLSRVEDCNMKMEAIRAVLKERDSSKKESEKDRQRDQKEEACHRGKRQLVLELVGRVSGVLLEFSCSGGRLSGSQIVAGKESQDQKGGQEDHTSFLFLRRQQDFLYGIVRAQRREQHRGHSCGR